MTVSTRRILSLALPMTGEQFLIFGIPLFDTAVAGSLGVEQISAQVVVVRWVQFTSVIYNVMGVGASILVAQAVGRGKPEDADHALAAALALAAISGGLLTLLVLLISPLLIAVMGVDAGVSALSLPYLRLIAFSFPFNFMLLSAVGCIRGAGNARTPLMVMGAANVIHVVTTLVLALSLGLGLQGIALATVISRLIGLILALALLARGVAGLRLIPFQPRLAAMRQLWRVGSPVGGEQLVLRVGLLVNLRLVTTLGTQVIAAYTVVSNSLSIVLTVGLGWMAAALTLVGQLVGAGARRQVHSTGWRILLLAWGVMGSLGLAFFLWPQVNRLFSTNAGVLDSAALGLRLIMLAIPFEVVNQVVTGVLRGAGDTRYPMMVSTLGHWLIRLPLIAILSGVIGLGLNGVWIAMIVEMAVRAAINLRRFNLSFLTQAQPEMSAV